MNYIALGLSIFSILWTSLWTVILYLLKPKLKIEIDRGIEKQEIRINIINKRCCSDAINLNIEACTVRNIDKTSHLDIDKADFLILPSNDYRIFTAECPQNIESKLKEIATILRVRVYATHSYSGFGRAKEQCFRYSEKENKFFPVKK